MRGALDQDDLRVCSPAVLDESVEQGHNVELRVTVIKAVSPAAQIVKSNRGVVLIMLQTGQWATCRQTRRAPPRR